MSDGKAVPAKARHAGRARRVVDAGKAPDSLLQVSQEEKAPFKTIASRPSAVIRSARVIAAMRSEGGGKLHCAKQ